MSARADPPRCGDRGHADGRRRCWRCSSRSASAARARSRSDCGDAGGAARLDGGGAAASATPAAAASRARPWCCPAAAVQRRPPARRPAARAPRRCAAPRTRAGAVERRRAPAPSRRSPAARRPRPRPPNPTTPAARPRGRPPPRRPPAAVKVRGRGETPRAGRRQEAARQQLPAPRPRRRCRAARPGAHARPRSSAAPRRRRPRRPPATASSSASRRPPPRPRHRSAGILRVPRRARGTTPHGTGHPAVLREDRRPEGDHGDGPPVRRRADPPEGRALRPRGRVPGADRRADEGARAVRGDDPRGVRRDGAGPDDLRDDRRGALARLDLDLGGGQHPFHRQLPADEVRHR